MATKRTIQLPTLNQNNQVTWGNSSQGGFLRKLPNELPWWDWPNPKNVIQTPQTDANGNITGWWWKKTAMNSPEEPEVWTYRGDNGVVQTINKNTQPVSWWFTQYSSKTDRSAAVMNANKNGTTSSLPQATPANLPWVTKYAGIDKNYWNNQAGIDLVNKQSELDALSEAEKAQRLAGAYNPTPPPTVATAQNPVIKKTLDKPQEQTVTPAAIQWADINTLNSTLDELNYKVNVEGKQLSKDEYLAYASAKRQLQEMMKPQALTGWLDNLITNKENEIKQVTDESKINNDQELADFTRSQEVYKQAEIDAINQADEEQKKTLWFILGWQGAGQGTFAVEQIGKITQNSLAKKQALNEAVQAKIDLYGSQLRKDSQQTIQAMKDRLDSYYMKAAEFDVDNIKQMNEYNAKEWASKIEQIDKMMALAQSQAMAMQPLTEQEQAQAQAFAGNLYDNEWNFQNNVFEMLYKVNPKLANAAVLQGTAIQKERISNDMAMRWLDADIKRAQLNKLLNPDVDWKDSGKVDVNGNPILYDPKNPTNTRTLPITWTSIDRDQATKSYWTTPAVRNFNPWNIMDTAFWGQKVEWERFTRFDTPQQWFNALVSKIENIQAGNSKVYSPNMTLLQYISKYAPASDNNNPQAYASQIAKKLWVSIDTTIWQLDPVKLASAHAQHEDKNSYKMLLDLWVITQDGSLWVAKATNLTPEKQTAIQDALFAIEDLEKTTWKEWAVGYSRQKNLNTLIPWGENKFIAGTDAANFEAKFNKLTNMLTLPNLDKLKGAMSDKDIAFLKSASSALSLNMSEAEFDTTLKQVKEKFQNMLWVQPQEQVKWWSIDDLRNDL